MNSNSPRFAASNQPSKQETNNHLTLNNDSRNFTPILGSLDNKK
jgi:hypothetical protein